MPAFYFINTERLGSFLHGGNSPDVRLCLLKITIQILGPLSEMTAVTFHGNRDLDIPLTRQDNKTYLCAEKGNSCEERNALKFSAKCMQGMPLRPLVCSRTPNNLMRDMTRQPFKRNLRGESLQ